MMPSASMTMNPEGPFLSATGSPPFPDLELAPPLPRAWEWPNCSCVRKLFEKLQAADEIYKNAEKNQNVRVKIDAEGEITVESSKTTVTFNEAKRARQLAAAKNLKDIQALMNLLQTDLSECEEGLKNNWCDEAEVKKVKKMIERAKQKMNELKKSDGEQENNFSSMDIII